MVPAQPETAEGRRHPRHPIRVPLYVTLADTIYRRFVPVESRDVSAGGLCFEAGRELPLEGRSRIVLERIGNLPTAASVEGRIAHVRPAAEPGRYRVGVEFTRFINVTREQIEAAIRAWERDLPDNRRSPRLALQRPLRIECDGMAVDAESVVVSLDGALVLSRTSFPVGSVLRVRQLDGGPALPFRVVRIGRPGGEARRELGLEALDKQPGFWGDAYERTLAAWRPGRSD